MNICSNQKLKRRGFTLIEMIGVLAVIAILASLLIPKIYEAINNSRISNAALSYNSVKTALADHFAKYGALYSSNGTPIVAADYAATHFDETLVSEGFSDKPFNVKIGSGSVVQVVDAVASGTAPTGTNPAYDLDGTGAANDAVGSAVVQCVITNVTLGDAFALSTLLDGASLSATNASVGTSDLKGRVKYDGTASPTLVYIYVTHR